MTNRFETNIVNLESLRQYAFSIPTYQRPYVWGDEELKKLLDDFYHAFKNNKDSIYYVSTFLTKEYRSDVAELIDGQQRFTTLWLISLVLAKLCPKATIAQFLKKGEKLRLSFEIRDEVSEFLNSLLDDNRVYNKIQNEDFIASQPYLVKIAKALVFINGYLRQAVAEEDLWDFGDFIYKNVYLVKNTAPPNTDLNKLFSVINSTGIQLEQTDIVKANLLKLIDDKVTYSKIWEACENTSNFFERNIRASFPESNWQEIDLANAIGFDPNIFKYQKDESGSENESDAFKIDDINLDDINTYSFSEKKAKNEKERMAEDTYCRSIISFGQLLLHTYRLHLFREGKDDFKGTFHVSRLIEVFKELEERNNPNEIKRFIQLLWDVRFLFDKYIIKWVSDSDTKEESLELMNLNKNSDHYYTRTKYEKSNSLMLQSVLYFTGDYLRQYWLTTYLGYLLEAHNDSPANSISHLKFLESLDNAFSLINTKADKELSWEFLTLTDTINNVIDIRNFSIDIDIRNYLQEPLSTTFKHYWFQKLEYVLWKNWEFRKDEKYLNYRITSRNSIEHIFPQNQDRNSQNYAVSKKDRNSFGNLVLLSVSQNSEYSNKPVSVKKSMFNERGFTYDTLKSYYIFKGDNGWGAREIRSHQEEMISKLLKHYNHA